MNFQKWELFSGSPCITLRDAFSSYLLLGLLSRCIFDKKQKILASAESFLALSDFEYSRVSYESLEGSIAIFLYASHVNMSKQGVFVFELFQ